MPRYVYVYTLRILFCLRWFACFYGLVFVVVPSYVTYTVTHYRFTVWLFVHAQFYFLFLLPLRLVACHLAVTPRYPVPIYVHTVYHLFTFAAFAFLFAVVAVAHPSYPAHTFATFLVLLRSTAPSCPHLPLCPVHRWIAVGSRLPRSGFSSVTHAAFTALPHTRCYTRLLVVSSRCRFWFVQFYCVQFYSSFPVLVCVLPLLPVPHTPVTYLFPVTAPYRVCPFPLPLVTLSYTHVTFCPLPPVTTARFRFTHAFPSSPGFGYTCVHSSHFCSFTYYRLFTFTAHTRLPVHLYLLRYGYTFTTQLPLPHLYLCLYPRCRFTVVTF